MQATYENGIKSIKSIICSFLILLKTKPLAQLKEEGELYKNYNLYNFYIKGVIDIIYIYMRACAGCDDTFDTFDTKFQNIALKINKFILCFALVLLPLQRI